MGSPALHRLTDGLAAQGLDVSAWPKEHLLRRLKRSALRAGEMFLDAHVERLLASQEELDAFVQGIAAGQRAFFGDGPTFAALEAHVLPGIVRSGHPPRALCLGCGCGYDAWSVAMLLAERCDAFELTAVDPREPLLAEAADGEYPEVELESVAWGRVRRWFVREDERFTVAADLRTNVTFRRFDHTQGSLPEGFGPGSLELIVCRGGLQPLWVEAREHLLSEISQALAPGGALVLAEEDEVVERFGPTRPFERLPLYLKSR